MSGVILSFSILILKQLSHCTESLPTIQAASPSSLLVSFPAPLFTPPKPGIPGGTISNGCVLRSKLGSLRLHSKNFTQCAIFTVSIFTSCKCSLDSQLQVNYLGGEKVFIIPATVMLISTKEADQNGGVNRHMCLVLAQRPFFPVGVSLMVESFIKSKLFLRVMVHEKHISGTMFNEIS